MGNPGSPGVNGLGGGGGPGWTNASGTSGGSGVVILSILTLYYTGTYTGSPTVITNGAYTVLNFTGNGTYTA